MQQLPDELLLAISDFAYPASFEGLLLSCKKFYAFGKHRLQDYKKEGKQYRNLTIHEPKDFADIRDLIDIVSWLIHYPHVARFVRSLQIISTEDDIRMGRRHCAVLRDTRAHPVRDNVADYIARSPWLRLAGCDAAVWASRILTFHDRACLTGSGHLWKNEPEFPMLYALLLMQLTRLEWLTVTYEPAILHEHDDRALACEAGRVLSVMSSHIGSGPSSGPKSPLEHLKTLHFTKRPEMDEVHDLTKLNAFITSPNLRSLHVTNVVSVSPEGNHHGFVYTWPRPLPTPLRRDGFSGVVDLRLVQCCMDGYGVAAMLRHMPHVTNFQYSHSDKLDGVQMDWDAGLFLRGVADPWAADFVARDGKVDTSPPGLASSTRITNLSICVEQLTGEIITRVTGETLRQFTALRHLELDVLVLMGPDAGTGERQGSIDSCGLRGEGACEWDAGAPGALPRLVDMLPPSIESLELFLDDNTHVSRIGHWGGLLDGFGQAEEWNDKMPRLQELKIDFDMPNPPTPRDIAQQWQNARLAAGVGAKYRGVQQMPWRAGFWYARRVMCTLGVPCDDETRYKNLRAMEEAIVYRTVESSPS